MPDNESKPTAKSTTQTMDNARLLRPEKTIGNYKILELIGEGGMGTVFLAQQEKPIIRKVALKIIKSGIDSRDIMARFETEQQALGLMNHPNIAQVYDSGQTEEGLPYFVMEYVPGVPITQHCDKYNLGTEDRLRLFEKVCEAVQHAHFRGIIHRDIKPSNVLVTFQDEKHIPKIIDFGIAKSLSGQRLTEKTLHTRYGVAIGTPSYMSPEQAEMTGYDIDTRTDVYSLGVMLYELLVGVTPFDEDHFREAGLIEVLRVIREEEPLRPSTRFMSLGEMSTQVAKKRGTNEIGLLKVLKGDLDWIVMKSMEKDRRRRYSAVADFMMDIERYLNEEPILARPPSLSYRMAKYIRKNKARSLAIFMMIMFVIVTSFLYNILSYQKLREKKKAELAIKETYYNYALALKEKARVFANDTQWQLSKLFSATSLLYQVKSQRFFSMLDVFPIGPQDFVIAHQLKHEFTNPRVAIHPSLPVMALWKWNTPNIEVWDIPGGVRVAVLKVQAEELTDVAFSRQGKLLAAGDSQGRIMIWDADNSNKIFALQGHSTAIARMDFAPDSRYLASGDKDGLIKTWDIPRQSESISFKGHLGRIDLITFSPDGHQLFSWSEEDDTFIAWDCQTGKMNASFRAHDSSFEMSPNANLILTRSYGETFGDYDVWNPATGKKIGSLPAGRNPVASICHDGVHVATLSEGESQIKIWEIRAGKVSVTATLDLQFIPGRFSSYLCFSPDARYLLYKNSDGSMKAWDWSKGEQVFSLQDTIRGALIPLRGDVFMVSNGPPGINIWERAGAIEKLRFRAHEGGVDALCLSPEGEFMASCGIMDKAIKVWDVQAGKLQSVLEGHQEPVCSLSFSPNAKYLASIEYDGSTIKIWDVIRARETASIEGRNFDTRPAHFSPDGKHLSAGSLDKDVRVWEVPDGRVAAILKGHKDSVNCVAFSPDGERLVSGSRDDSVILWSLPLKQNDKQLAGHTGDVIAVAFSDDGKLVVSWGLDEILRIWEVSTGRQISSIAQMNRLNVSTSPDAKFIGAGDWETKIKVWESRSGQEIACLTNYGGNVLGRAGRLSASFASKKRYMAARDERHGAVIYETPSFLPISHLESGNTDICALECSRGGTLLASGLKNGEIVLWDMNLLFKNCWLNLPYPYTEQSLKEVLEILRNQSGFILDGYSPYHSLMYYRAGETALDHKEYAEALDNFSRVLSMDPNHPLIDYSLGLTYSHLQENDKARFHFEQALKKNPKNGDARRRLVLVYLVQEELDKAYDSIVQLVEKGPAWNATLAAKDLENFQASKPNSHFAHLLRGYIAKSLKNNADAADNFKKFLELFQGQAKWRHLASELMKGL